MEISIFLFNKIFKDGATDPIATAASLLEMSNNYHLQIQ